MRAHITCLEKNVICKLQIIMASGGWPQPWIWLKCELCMTSQMLAAVPLIFQSTCYDLCNIWLMSACGTRWYRAHVELSLVYIRSLHDIDIQYKTSIQTFLFWIFFFWIFTNKIWMFFVYFPFAGLDRLAVAHVLLLNSKRYAEIRKVRPERQ